MNVCNHVLLPYIHIYLILTLELLRVSNYLMLLVKYSEVVYASFIVHNYADDLAVISMVSNINCMLTI